MKHATEESVKKAEGDYEAALREKKARAHDLVCFLAQQAIEKYLKGLLEERNVPFPKTHDLRLLAKLALKFCPALQRFVLRFGQVSEYAVLFRYPGAWADSRKSLRAVKTAAQARETLRKALGLSK